METVSHKPYCAGYIYYFSTCNSPSMATFPKRFTWLLSEGVELLTKQTSEHFVLQTGSLQLTTITPLSLHWLTHELCTYLDKEETRKCPMKFSGAPFVTAAFLTKKLFAQSRWSHPEKIPRPAHTRTVFFLSNWQKTRALCRHWSLPRGPPLFMKVKPNYSVNAQSHGNQVPFREPGQQKPWTRYFNSA